MVICALLGGVLTAAAFALPDSAAEAFPSSYCGHGSTMWDSGGVLYWVDFQTQTNAPGNEHYHRYFHNSSPGSPHTQWKLCGRWH